MNESIFVAVIACAFVASCGGGVSTHTAEDSTDSGYGGAVGNGGQASIDHPGAGGGATGGRVASGGAGGRAGADPAKDAAADAPTPLDPYEFCAASWTRSCLRMAKCCTSDGAAYCEAPPSTWCIRGAAPPEGYDPLRAEACLLAEERAVVTCRSVRADTVEAAEKRAACKGMHTLWNSVGAFCASNLGYCDQLPEVSVWCNSQSEGGGSQKCERGYPRAHEGERCGGMTTCVDGFYCDAGKCARGRADGTACIANSACASGFCDSSSKCAVEGQLIATENDCRSLFGD